MPMWLLLCTLGLAGCLRLTKAPCDRLQLFQSFCSNEGLLSTVLHSINVRERAGLSALHRIISDRRIPFEHIYIGGCQRHLDFQRFDELEAAIRRHGQPAYAKTLLSVDCLSASGLRLGGERLSMTILGSLNTKRLPLLEGSRALVQQIWGSARPSGTRYPGLLPSCALLRGHGVPESFWRCPPSHYLGAYGWMAFHHSCFKPNAPDQRSSNAMVRWMLHDGPRGLAELDQSDPSALARWLVHLCLVLQELAPHDLRLGDSAFLIYQYLWVAARMLDASKAPGLKVLHGLVLSTCSLWSGGHFDGFQGLVGGDTGQMPLLMDSLELVLGNLPPDQEARWTLSVVDFYFRASPYEVLDSEVRCVLCKALLSAAELEVADWLLRFVELPRHLAFLGPELSTRVKASADLQQLLLDSAALSEKSPRSLVIEAVPFEARLRHARRLVLECEVVWSFIDLIWDYLLPAPEGHLQRTIPALVHAFISDFHAKGIAIAPLQGMTQLDAQKLSCLAFVVSLAALFETGLPVAIPEARMKLIIGFEGSDSALVLRPFPCIETVAGRPSRSFYAWLNDAASATREVLPLIFTWEEFYRLASSSRPFKTDWRAG